MADAHIIHLVWECTALGGFLEKYFRLIYTQCTVHHMELPAEPLVYVLGCVDVIVQQLCVAISISLLLYLARKRIVF